MIIRRSEINRAREITEDRWALTLARKTQGAHQQHAFFILEGIENEQAVVRFMDLVGNSLLPNINKAHIRIVEIFEADEAALAAKALVFRCDRQMMDLRENESIAYVQWPITRQNAFRLINAITRDKEMPPLFNIIGKNSLLTASSAHSSSKDRGHNCFTFAKAKIEELDVPTIKISCDNTAYYMEHIAGITSLTLKNTNNSTSYCPYFAKVAVVGFGLLAAGYFSMEEIRHRYNMTP